MEISKLIDRSKHSFEEDLKDMGCSSVDEDLVRVLGNKKLLVQPIWTEPVTHPEGRLYEEYISKKPLYNAVFLRREVAKRLYQLSENLPSNLALVIRAGHRPMEVQSRELQLVADKYLKENSGSTQEDALRFARTFVDDPSIKIPSHCCGSAVDVELMDISTGALVDFGCSMNTESEEAYLHSTLITKAQYANRLILLRAMLEGGFAPTCVEWWHFSYGDTVWAYFYDKPHSLYGNIEPSLE